MSLEPTFESLAQRPVPTWFHDGKPVIFGTRPWVTAQGQTSNGLSVRFTQSGDSRYVVLRGTPQNGKTALEKLRADAGTVVQMLCSSEPLQWDQDDNRIVVSVPSLVPAPAHTLKITPRPVQVS